MDIATIQSRIDAMVVVMLAKGKKKPDATFSLRSNASFSVCVRWDKPKDVLGEYKYFRGDDALDQADAFLAELPSPEQAKFNEFMTALGGVIDLGRENGIETEFLNPLSATMKRLSENALTFQEKPEQVPA